LYDPLAQRDGKLKRGKKKKMMKNNKLDNTANKKSKSASMLGLCNEEDFSLSPREGLYNKPIEQLCEMLKISEQEYLRYAFSKEQLVEFILTPKD
jgi:hypothetical protein